MFTEPGEGPVIVDVDGSPRAESVVDVAAEEAALRHAPLVMVHACTELTADLRRARSLLQVAATHARVRWPDVPVTAELLTGDTVDALVHRAAGAAVVVLDQPVRRGRRHPPKPVLMEAIHRCGVPVLIPCPGAGPDRPVLVGLLGHADCEPAVEFAFTEASLRGVPLHTMAIGPASDNDHAVDELVARWAEKCPDVVVSHRVRRALDPAVTLTAASRSAGLVVISMPPGAHGWAEAIARVLMSRAGCPVTLVPGAPATT